MQDTKNYESNTSNRASAIIIVPYQVAVMPLDLTKTQLDALVIAMMMLQPQLQSLLNHEQTHEELMRWLVTNNGAGQDLLRFPFTMQGMGLTRHVQMALADATKVPNLGLRVITHHEDKGSCLYMTVGMASSLLDLSKGYFYVSPQLCLAMRSRYAVRLYWLMQAHSHQHGFTMSIAQLRATLCPKRPNGSYAHFERNVIAQPLATLQKYYANGQLPSYMLLCRLYNRRRHQHWEAAGTALRGSGRPDALKFTIVRRENAAPASATFSQPAPAKTAPTHASISLREGAAPTSASRQGDIVFTLLHDDLQLPEQLAAREALRVTDNLRPQFVNYAIMLKEVIDEKRSRRRPLKNQVAYVLTSLHRFFEQQERKGETSDKGRECRKDAMKPQDFEEHNSACQLLVKKENATKSLANGDGTERPSMKETVSRRALADGEGISSSGSVAGENKAATPDETGENCSTRSAAELRQCWQMFLSSYSGKAVGALGRARLTGQLRDGFLVSFTSDDDEQAFREDFDAVQRAARKALSITSRFQPGVIVDN
jgi:hypothetical protein